MSTQQASTLKSVSPKPVNLLLGAERSASNGSSGQQLVFTDGSTKNLNLLAEHKEKLAVGTAAMLGLAIFYKWREGQLAKDDPEEFERLRRLKAAIETVEPQPQREEPNKDFP